MNIASRPPATKKKIVVDEVLDPDHLVVGVDAEVVAPAPRAVARVVLGPRRRAERVAHPVVERRRCRRGSRSARGQQRDGRDHRPVPDRVPAAPPAEDDARCRRRSRRRAPIIHGTRSQPGARSRRQPLGRRRAPARGLAVLVDGRSLRSLLAPRRRGRLTSGVELRLGQARERRRHHALRVARLDVGVRVHDRLPDERLERLARLLRLGRELIEVGADLPGRAGGA